MAQPISASGASLDVPNRRLISISIMLATIMQTLDSTIANVALPHMQGALSASQDQITWVLTSYIVAAAIGTPMTGWLAARFGRKQVFLVSVAGFTVASALCGISESLVQIVAARLLQGMFGAALVPLSQAVLLDINPREKHTQAIALWGMGVTAGPILGPTIGGWLTDAYNWRWVFFINVPLGAIAFFGIMTAFRDHASRLRPRFDVFGFATLSIAIGSLQLLVDRGQQLDWFSSLEIWIEALVFLISFAYFVAHTVTAGTFSFFNAALLKDQNFVAGIIFGFILGIVLYASRALIPPMLQTLMGYPAVVTGFATAPSGIGTMLAMLLIGRLVHLVGARVLLFSGMILTAFSLWQMCQYTLVISEWDVIIPGFIQGMGLGLVFVPMSTMTFSTLSPTMRADGTSIYALSRNIGGSIGISVLQTLLYRNSQLSTANLTTHINAYNPLLNAANLSGFDIHSPTGLALLGRAVDAQALMIAYVDDFRFMFLMTLLTIPFMFFLRPGHHKPTAEESAHLMAD
ncbi:MAG: DHA2 family efflux MFS transporter permease subunit [Janthinobacterium lividum]